MPIQLQEWTSSNIVTTFGLPPTGSVILYVDSTTQTPNIIESSGTVIPLNGTVTSVGLTAPSIFTVGSSPITTSGNISITFATGQTANQFLATPNGTTGAVGLRAIVATDIPTLNQNTTGSAGSVPASGITGTTLSSSVVTSSLTTVGTLTNLTVTNAPVFSALSGYLYGNGSGAVSASSTIPTTALSGTLQAAQEPVHTGDVTNTAGSLAMTVGKIQGIQIASGTPLAGESFTYTGSQWIGLPQFYNIQAFGADPTTSTDSTVAIYNAIISCAVTSTLANRTTTTANATTGTSFSISVAANSLATSGTLVAQTTLGPVGFTYSGGGGTTTLTGCSVTWGVSGGIILSGSIIGVYTGTNVGGIVFFPAGIYETTYEITNSIPGIWFVGVAGTADADVGSYTLSGGSWIYYNGFLGGTALRNVPITGTSGIQGGQQLTGIRISNLNANCSSYTTGYGLAGIGFQMISCVGYWMENLFVQNACKSAYEWTVLGASMLGSGEAEDCTRGIHINLKARQLEAASTAANTSAAVNTNPSATTNLDALSNSTVTLGTSVTTGVWPSNGLALFQAVDQLTGNVMWYQVSYTSVSGTTMSGATTLKQWYNQTNSVTLNAATPSSGNPLPNAVMFAGSKIMPAQGAFGSIYTLHGSATANTCESTWLQGAGNHFMGAAGWLGNCDTNVFQKIVFNRTTAGTPTGNGWDVQGSTLSGSAGASGCARNNHWISGSPGSGGLVLRGTESFSYLNPASPNIWEYQEMGNGEPVPVAGTGCHLVWTPNGGLHIGGFSYSTASQAFAASATGFINGTTIILPPQGLQIGTTIRWTVPMTKTAAGTALTFAVRYGTTNTFAGDTTAIATAAYTGTAVLDGGVLTVTMTILTLGASATAIANANLVHLASATTGFVTTAAGAFVQCTMASFNSGSTVPGPAYLNLAVSANTATVLTINAPVTVEVIKAAGP